MNEPLVPQARTPQARAPQAQQPHTRPPRQGNELAASPAQKRTSNPRTKAQAQDSRVHNRALVLATLYHGSAMSRAELSRVSGLTAPTVSALVADLEADGLVADVEPPRESGRRRGKPSMLVAIQDDAVNLVTLDLSPAGAFRGAVMNLRGKALARGQIPIGDALGAEAAALVPRLAAELVAAAPGRVLGIGVASPGIIDRRGVIRQAAHLGWNDMPVAAGLADAFGVPAHAGNDVNLAALAALHFGRTPAQSLMVVGIEHGVGAGLIVDGKLVEGEQFAAGEIGHLTVDPDGEECVCGRRGCLDPLIDAARLTEKLAGATADERARVLGTAGVALGRILAPIASALNLNEIGIMGPADLVEGPLTDTAQLTARAYTLSPISASLHVRSLSSDLDLPLLGAACMVLSGELGVL